MNALSALSIILYTSFFIGAINVATAERKGVLNISACAVLISLGWWSFCNSFFFAAATPEQAWVWHKFSSIGWCGFVPLTAYYFLALTNHMQKWKAWWKQALFFAPAVVLLCKNLFGKTTSLAQAILPSTSGWGWTYQNTVTSVWLWIYLLYVALYFGIAFYLLFQWYQSVEHRMKKDMAIRFILLDLLTILTGVVTDVILPLTTPVLPAMASLATALFFIGYFSTIYRYDVFNINLVISSDDILQTSSNPIFVLDERREILKYNRAAGSLLGYSKNELIGLDFTALTEESPDWSPLTTGGELADVAAKIHCRNGNTKDVLLAASVAQDRWHSFLCTIVSCQDVSKQKKMQDELALEREKYKQLANDYQMLAYFDPLTGLPNRRHFFDTLSKYEARYQTEGLDFAVIFLDLDNFKRVNDLYGHRGGDDLLKVAATKLQSCAETDDFVARLGGDEFTVILPYTEPSCADRKMQRILDVFHQRVPFNGSLYEIGISAGYGVFSHIGDTAKLMQYADEAMYGNKNATFRRTSRNQEPNSALPL
ncbi:MAG: diguanylate cyclase [Oscillospiraceae bacterium]